MPNIRVFNEHGAELRVWDSSEMPDAIYVWVTEFGDDENA